MSKHTPGPWHITRDDLDSGEIAWHVFAEKGNVCRMYRRDADDIRAGAGSAKADALLIAAAPDLLEMLELMAAQHFCGCRHPACKRCAEDDECAVVIAKAKGEK